jgi:hypothetical protein
LTLIAGYDGEFHIGYHPSKMAGIAKDALDMLGRDAYDKEEHAKLEAVAAGGFEGLKKYIWNESNEFWNSDGTILDDEMAGQYKQFQPVMKTMAECLTGIDSVVINGLPGLTPTTEFVVTFDNVNPFLFPSYMLSELKIKAEEESPNMEANPNMSADNAGYNNAASAGVKPQSGGVPQKQISEAETERLRACFKKYDKDNSGAIDLKELKAMCDELGGQISMEEAQEAMEQLDLNKDGTCDFKEFLGFWTTKKGLGGYSSLALKFLKYQMAAQGVLDASTARFTNMFSAPVTETDETGISYCYEVTPGSQPLQPKMTAKAVFKKSEGEPVKPKVECKLICMSPAAATKIKELIENKIKEFDPDGEMMKMNLGTLTVSTDEAFLTVSLQLEEGAQAVEQLEAVLNQVDQLEVFDILKGVSAEVRCELGYDFDDMVASPDRSVFQNLGGGKTQVDISITNRAKRAAVAWDPRKFGMYEGHFEMDARQMMQKMFSAFAGAKLRVSGGYHEAQIAKLLAMEWPLPPGIPNKDMTGQASTIEEATGQTLASITSPAGLRKFLLEFQAMQGIIVKDVMDEVPDGEANFQQGNDFIANIRGIASISVEGVSVPGGNTNLAVRVDFEKANPAGILRYMIQPFAKQCGLGDF